MNRPLLIAALIFLLTSVPLSAQRGGGHASGGGHGGGMAAHGGFGGHAGGRGFSGSGRGARSFSRRPSFSQPFASRNFNHFRGVPFRNGFRNNCFGRRCRGFFGYGYPYYGYGYPWYGGEFDPSWDWDSGSSYDPDQQYETGLANQMNQQSLDEQRMRAQSDQDIYEPAAPRRQRAEQTSEIVPPTVLVFRDQHKKEVQNYAIIGQTLWNFAPQHTEKIPLSDLDLTATAKANDDRGVDFRTPVTHEGQ
jgi:hypothetical protein